MAKTNTKTTESIKASKPRTAEQKRRDQLKKEQNIAAAARRLEALQARQKAEVEAARIAAKTAPAIAMQQRDEDNYVASALAGHFGGVLQRWLANRTATFERVKRFFDERPAMWKVLPVDPAIRTIAEAAKAERKQQMRQYKQAA